MRTLLLFPALLIATGTLAQNSVPSYVLLPFDSPELHLIKQVPPEYPAIAKAVHMHGQVWIVIDIGADGHVPAARVLDGPAMLSGSALECIRQWIYQPILRNGLPTPVSTTVHVDFNLPGDMLPNDTAIAGRFFPLEDACKRAISSHADIAQQAARCTQAADAGEALTLKDRYIQKRDAFVNASATLRSNKQFRQALDYANKAVAIDKLIVYSLNDAGTAAVYTTRAQAEAALGDLAAASGDLTTAEDYQRRAAVNMAVLNPDYERQVSNPALKALLNLHAQVLSAMGRSQEAAVKRAEAAKL